MTEERKPPMSIDEIEAAALLLPEEERDELIARLSASLATEQEIDAAWRAEVRRRVGLINAGDVQWVDGDEVMAELRADP
jgi:putative addiction module component (TIGR02574 family)